MKQSVARSHPRIPFRRVDIDTSLYDRGAFWRADYLSAFLSSEMAVPKDMEVLIIAKKELQINEQIRDTEVRVIGADGAQLGVMSSKDAQKLADEAGLDLVKIAPTATPPVCRVMDFGKYRFEQAKKEKEARKNQHVVEIKEVRLGLNTDVGDFNTKVNQAVKFLQHGDKVKVNIRFRGREMAHPEMGLDPMNRFAEALAEVATVEKPAKLEGRNMMMFLVPKAAK